MSHNQSNLSSKAFILHFKQPRSQFVLVFMVYMSLYNLSIMWPTYYCSKWHLFVPMQMEGLGARSTYSYVVVLSNFSSISFTSCLYCLACINLMFKTHSPSINSYLIMFKDIDSKLIASYDLKSLLCCRKILVRTNLYGRKP